MSTFCKSKIQPPSHHCLQQRFAKATHEVKQLGLWNGVELYNPSRSETIIQIRENATIFMRLLTRVFDFKTLT